MESNGEMLLCEEVQDSYHASCLGDASIVLRTVNLDAQHILNMKNEGIVPMDDMLTWDVESFSEEEREVEMDATMTLNVAKAKARLYGMKNEQKDAGSPTPIASNASHASTHVSRVLKEIAFLHDKMLGALCVWPPHG